MFVAPKNKVCPLSERRLLKGNTGSRAYFVGFTCHTVFEFVFLFFSFCHVTPPVRAWCVGGGLTRSSFLSMGGKKRQRSHNDHNSEPKRQHGEGEYPPPHVLESAAFESYYRENGIVPADEWEQFIGCLRQPLGVSFRITGHPDDPSSLSLRDYMERAHISRLSSLVMDDQPVPPPYPITWYPGRLAWRFDVSRSILRGKGALKNDDSTAARNLAAFHNFLMAETVSALPSFSTAHCGHFTE